jgi:hypothetical protein
LFERERKSDRHTTGTGDAAGSVDGRGCVTKVPTVDPVTPRGCLS